MAIKTVASEVRTEILKLDLDNPRLYHHRLSGNVPETESELMEAIGEDPQFKSLLKSIRKSGVMDPIWTVPQEDGTHLVIEGNRRLTCLRMLLDSGHPAPVGVTYERVRANVIDPDTSPKEIKLQKARLQTGKAVWGKFNVSALIWEFHNEDLMALEDIATEMQLSLAEVKKSMESYTRYLDYSRDTGDTNPKRFSMFEGTPKAVKEWIDESPENKRDFHKWINPTSGKARIRSVATRGGLRDFTKVVEDADAIKLMRDDERVSVEEAIEVVKQNNVMRDMPFLKQLLPLQAKMNGMSEAQKARLTTEPRLKIHLKSLRDACEALLRDLDAFES